MGYVQEILNLVFLASIWHCPTSWWLRVNHALAACILCYLAISFALSFFLRRLRKEEQRSPVTPRIAYLWWYAQIWEIVLTAVDVALVVAALSPRTWWIPRVGAILNGREQCCNAGWAPPSRRGPRTKLLISRWLKSLCLSLTLPDGCAQEVKKFYDMCFIQFITIFCERRFKSSLLTFSRPGFLRGYVFILAFLSAIVFVFLQGHLGVKRSAPYWTVWEWAQAYFTGSKLLLNFTKPCCPQQPFMQTWSCCLGLRHVGLRTSCVPLMDCEAVTLM